MTHTPACLAMLQFTNAFEDAAIGMGLASLDGRWAKVNRALCEMLGYSEEELLATTIREVTHSEDQDVTSEQIRRLFSGEVKN